MVVNNHGMEANNLLMESDNREIGLKKLQNKRGICFIILLREGWDWHPFYCFKLE